MPFINLPTLLQKVRIDTTSMDAAIRKGEKFGAAFESGTGRAQVAIDDFADSQDRYVEKNKEVEASNRTSADSFRDLRNSINPLKNTINKTTTENTKYQKAAGDSGGKNRDLIKSIGGLVGGFSAMKLAMAGIKFGVMIGAMGQLVPLLAAAGGAAAGFVAAIAPAVGVVGAIVPAMGALGAAAGVAMLAFKDLELTEAGLEFQGILEGLKDEFLELQAIAQENLLPGLGDAVLKFEPFLNGEMQQAVANVALALADAANIIADDLMTPQFRKDFEDLSVVFGDILRTAAPALSGLVKLFVKIGRTAGPMTERLIESFTGLIDKMNAIPDEKMQAFFDTAGDVFLKLAGAVGDFTLAIADISGIANTTLFGPDGIVGGISSAASKFKEWTSSAEGSSAIKKFFEDIKPLVDEIWQGIQDVAGVIARLATDPNTAEIVRRFREDLLPVIENIVTKVGEALPGIVTFLAGVGSVIAAIPFTLLGGLADDLGNLLLDIGTFLQKAPELAAVLAGILTARTIQKNFNRLRQILNSSFGDFALGRGGGGGGDGNIFSKTMTVKILPTPLPVTVTNMGAFPGGGKTPPVYPVPGAPGVPGRTPTPVPAPGKWTKVLGALSKVKTPAAIAAAIASYYAFEQWKPEEGSAGERQKQATSSIVTGATIGSMFGPWGTLAGTAIGATVAGKKIADVERDLEAQIKTLESTMSDVDVAAARAAVPSSLSKAQATARGFGGGEGLDRRTIEDDEAYLQALKDQNKQHQIAIEARRDENKLLSQGREEYNQYKIAQAGVHADTAITTRAADAANRIAEETTRALNQIPANAGVIGSEARKQFDEKFAGVVTDADEKAYRIAEVMEKNKGSVKEAGKVLGTEAATAVYNGMDGVTTAAEERSAQIARTIEGAKPAVSTAFSDIGGASTKAFNDALKLGKTAEDETAAIPGRISVKQAEIAEAATAAGTAARTAFSTGITPIFTDTDEKAALIAERITKHEPTVAAAGTTLATAATTAFNAALGPMSADAAERATQVAGGITSAEPAISVASAAAGEAAKTNFALGVTGMGVDVETAMAAMPGRISVKGVEAAEAASVAGSTIRTNFNAGITGLAADADTATANIPEKISIRGAEAAAAATAAGQLVRDNFNNTLKPIFSDADEKTALIKENISKHKPGIAQAAKEAGTSAADNFALGIGPIQSLADEKTSLIASTITEKTAAIGAAGAAAGETAKTNFSAGISGMGADTDATLSAIPGRISVRAVEAAEAATVAGTTIRTNFNSGITGLTADVEAATLEIPEKISIRGAEAAAAATIAGQSVRTNFSNALDPIFTDTDEKTALIKERIEKHKPTITTAAQNTGAAAATSFATGIGQITTLTDEKTAQIASTITGKTAAISTASAAAGTAAKTSFAAGISGMTTDTDTAMAAVPGRISVRGIEAAEAATLAGTTIRTNFGAGITGMSADTEVATAGIPAKISARGAEAAAAATVAGQSVRTNFSTALNPVFSDTDEKMALIKERISAGSANISGAATAAGTSAKTSFDTAYKAVVPATATTMTNTATAITTSSTNVNRAGAAAGEAAKTNFSTGISGMPIAASNAMSATAGAINAGKAQTDAAARNVSSGIASNINTSGFVAKGNAIVEALAAGILQKANVASAAMGRVTAGMGKSLPGSPVEEGALRVLNRGYAGKQIVQMIADGMRAGTSQLDTAMSRIAAMLAASFTKFGTVESTRLVETITTGIEKGAPTLRAATEEAVTGAVTVPTMPTAPPPAADDSGAQIARTMRLWMDEERKKTAGASAEVQMPDMPQLESRVDPRFIVELRNLMTVLVRMSDAVQAFTVRPPAPVVVDAPVMPEVQVSAPPAEGRFDTKFLAMLSNLLRALGEMDLAPRIEAPRTAPVEPVVKVEPIAPPPTEMPVMKVEPIIPPTQQFDPGLLVTLNQTLATLTKTYAASQVATVAPPVPVPGAPTYDMGEMIRALNKATASSAIGAASQEKIAVDQAMVTNTERLAIAIEQLGSIQVSMPSGFVPRAPVPAKASTQNNTTNNVVVNNPVGQPVERSIIDTLTLLQLGVLR